MTERPRLPLDPDGTSQAARRPAALDPGYVSIDERGPKDWLELAREYLARLRYYDSNERDVGDWRALLPESLQTREVLAFLEDPQAFEADAHSLLHRPHLSLFLVFLELLSQARDRLNTLTGRHLDFHFETVLGLGRKPPVPDRVRVLFQLAPGVDEALVQAQSVLNAGPDSAGLDRHYMTERDLVVNRAEIAQRSSIFVEREIVDFEQARRLHRNDVQQTTLELFKIALGEPEPGDPLPLFTEIEGGQASAVDFALLVRLHDLLKLAHDRLRLRFFELRDLLNKKHHRDQADWPLITALLVRAEGLSFDGVLDVKTLDALYQERERDDVKAFITRERSGNVEGLGMALDEFDRVMEAKIDLDSDWKAIEDLLGRAARQRDPAWQQPDDIDGQRRRPEDADDFSKLLVAAVGQENLDALPGADLEVFWERVLRIQTGFFLSAEAFEFVMWVSLRTGGGENPAEAREWEKVDSVLTKAHREKVWSRNRDRLADIWDQHQLIGVVRSVLGEGQTSEREITPLLEELKPLLGAPSDLASLRRIAAVQGNPTPEQKEEAVEILEFAERNRDRLEPVPRRQRWLSLHPAIDATSVQVRSAISSTADLERWRTFGQAPESESPPAPAIGWAVCSPVLALAEGKRTIFITIGSAPTGVDAEALELAAAKQPFDVQLSTEKGWVTLAPDKVKIEAVPPVSPPQPGERRPPPDMRFTLEVEADFDPIAPLAEGGPGHAAVRLMLRQTRDGDPFRSLYVESISIEVDVEGLRELVLRTDETLPSASKPFEPFGNAPAAGSRLAIGHREIVSKKLDELTFRFEWMGAPKKPADHYTNYPAVKGKSFTAKVRMVDAGRDGELHAGAKLLPGTDDGKQSIRLRFGDESPREYQYEAAEIDSSDEDPTRWRRYFEWELNQPDFQHSAYPAIATAMALEFSRVVAKNELGDSAKSFEVKPPYTPKLKGLSVDYRARLELPLGGGTAHEPGSTGGGVLHIHPFGTSEARRAHGVEGVPLLPRYENEGELLIGLTGLRPPQTVTLFFQMAEGSANPDLARAPVRWSRLSGDRFESLDDVGKVLSDSTRGLINSGIVELALDPSVPSTRLPAHKDGEELYWVRASVASDSRAICDTVAIHTQAVAATFEDRGNAPDHFAQALPAESIKAFEIRRPEIATVLQPYTSFGGRRAEEDSLFATRVSERLRHKGRALSMWDYERIVLQRFPEIYKAKCLPGKELGEVDLVVIPDVRSRRPVDPSGPKVPSDLLVEIQSYLSDRAPTTATLRVMNPHYVAVKVRVAVRFKGQGNEEFYRRRLNQELNEYLSPWAYEKGDDIAIGGKVYANSLVDFLDRQPYVDYLADLELFFSEDGVDFEPAPEAGEEGYAVSIQRSDAVFVAAQEHWIDPIPEAGYRRETTIGINFMRLELDFKVAPDEENGESS